MDVIEYLEQLEVLEATEKKQSPKNSQSENKTKESSKSRNKSQKGGFRKKNNKKRKQRSESSESENSDKKFCAYCKGTDGRYWTHNTEDCYFIKNLGNKKTKKSHNTGFKSSKEFNTLIKTELNSIVPGAVRNAETAFLRRLFFDKMS